MLKYYIKTSIRNFQTNKLIFAGRLATLCLGALCISLLFSYVHNELTMDDFHNNEEDIYLVTMKQSPKSEWIGPFSFKSTNYPEIESSTSLMNFPKGDAKLKYNQFTYTPSGIVVDSSFFKVFSFDLLFGNKNTILKDVQAIILSESFSKKVFGEVNPIGKEIDFEMRQHQGVHVVQGVIKIPSNSSLEFDYLIPNAGKHYGRMNLPFIRTRRDFNLNIFNEKIKNSNNKVPKFYPQLTESTTKVVKLKELYFDSELSVLKNNYIIKSGNKDNLEVLFVIIIVILLVSILNYANLQIVNINSEIKSLSISKVNGAQKRHLYIQKLLENSIILCLGAFVITLGYNLVLPYFNAFIMVSLEPPIWKVLMINAIILSVIIAIGIVYPLIVISRYSAINNIKKNFQGTIQIKGKNAIVVVQYALAFLLLISAIIVDRQLHLMLDKDLGFNNKNIMKVKLYYEPPFNPEMRKWSKERVSQERENRQKTPTYINDRLASFSSIEKVSQGNSPLNVFSMDWKRKDNSVEYEGINTLTVTPDYKELFDFKLVDGRFFDFNSDVQRGNKIVINEAVKRLWGITDISKDRIKSRSWGTRDKKGYEIIGVVNDFNYEHLSAKPKPLVMVFFDDPEADYFVKFHEGSTEEGIKSIEKLFTEVNPNQTFKYTFLSNEIAALYQKEKRLSTIYILFTIIALLISAIGLFTIALYDTQQRTKEIGVRKVNGATINEIMLMLNKDFVKWVGIAFVIACPVTYYAMSNWLENFAYKTSLSWWVFAMAGLFTMILALLTVSWQSYRAATRNPVEALRDE